MIIEQSGSFDHTSGILTLEDGSRLKRDARGDWQDADQLCACGSGYFWNREYDGQGIYLCRACDKCRKEKLSHYRPEILTGYSQADVDEPIDYEY